MSRELLQVYEQSYLPIGRQFQRKHWVILGNYNDAYGGRFFQLTPDGIRFNQYVGVIQVAELTIEILPKVSRDEEEGSKIVWQQVLIDMLQECHWLKIYSHQKAALRFKLNSILDTYLQIYVSACEELLRRGLIKKYRSVDRNGYALKGKLLFAQQIHKNLIHQERFYTRQDVYDPDHLLNQILLKALKIIPRLSSNPLLKDKVYQLLTSFPELSDTSVQVNTFQKLIYNRKNHDYKEAIDIAAMLLLNYRPDIAHGREDVLAILFDMNQLWEEFIFLRLKKSMPVGWNIWNQDQKVFWKQDFGKKGKNIKPDIIVESPLKQTFVLDTKWKLPEELYPADEDLKQMFVYNEYWNASHAILIYPKNKFSNAPTYHSGSFINRVQKCGMLKISVLNETHEKLDELLGRRLHDFIDDISKSIQ